MTRKATHRSLVLLAGLLIVVAGCGGGSTLTPSPTAPANVSEDQVEFQSFQLVNDAREKERVDPPLDMQDLLCEVARKHSEAMRDDGFIGHVGPDGKNLRARLRAAGVTFQTAGENLAKVWGAHDPAAVAHSELMASASHRENILNPGFEMVGVGVARSGDSYWVTQIFVRF